MELEPSSYEEALEVLRQYPFFAYEALKALDLAPDAEAKARMKAILAVNVGEISDLREILGLNSDSLTDFYPDSVPPQLTTDDTIATFLDHFGHQPARTPASAPAEPCSDPASDAADSAPDGSDATLQDAPIPLPVAPQFDYISQLEAQSSAAEDEMPPAASDADDTLSAIDAFLAEVPPAQPRPKAAPKPAPSPADRPATAPIAPAFRPAADPHSPEPGMQAASPESAPRKPEKEQSDSGRHNADTTALSEGFAKILIKNRNYSKALEIIEELNLKNPEKSIYFADQIRFLKKLIINQSKS